MDGSTALQAGFVLMGLAVVAGVALVSDVFGSRRFALRVAFGACAWAVLTWALAAQGLLADFSLPPRLLLVFVPGLLLTLWLARVAHRAGVTQAPQVVLIGAQAFRVVVERLIHQAVGEGVAPPQMTWPWPGAGGMNPDLLTAVTTPAMVVLLWKGWVGRRGVLLWNAMGLVCLATVVSVGVLSMPTPFQRLHPDNVWIAYAPYVWLPSLMVTAAIWLHLLSLAKALQSAAGRAAALH